MTTRKKTGIVVEVVGQTSTLLYHDPPDIEHVPTVRELAAQGLAHTVSDKGHYRLTAEGQRLIYEAMQRNAERRRAANAGPRELQPGRVEGRP